MEELFTWSDEYTVGEAVIDQQHKEIFDLGNRLPDSSHDDINAIVLNLYKHVRLHFSYEEDHMKRIGYPSLDEHRALHDGLIDKLNIMTAKPLNDEFLIKEFQTFVYYWIMDHLLKHDHRYFEFVRKKQQTM